MNAVTDLVVKVQGAITESNFDAYKAQIINQIKSANKELKTDDDFVEAENTVKQFQAAEKAIVQSKTDALEQAAEVQRMFEAMDEVNEEVRQARLSLQKQIKQRKEQIKTDLVDEYAGFVADHYDELCESSPNFRLVRPNPFDSYDVLLESIKGLKTVKSIESRLIDESDELKTKLDILDGEYVANKKTLDFVDEKHKPLFQDEKALLSMDAELLTATIEKRIATHQAEELKRQQAEAEAKAEAERLAAEKVRNEQESAEIKEPTEPANIPTYKPVIGEHGYVDHSTEVVTNSEPVVDAQTTDSPEPKSELFLLSIPIEAETDRAKEIARSISDLLADVDEVKEIKLIRGN